MTRWKAYKNMGAWIWEKGGPFIFLFALSQFRGPTISEPIRGYVFSFIRYSIKKKCVWHLLLFSYLNCFLMLFGISTTVFYIFILVSFYRSAHACLTKYSTRFGKIKFGLLSSCLTFMSWTGLDKNNKRKKLTKLISQNNELSRTWTSHILTTNS